MSLPTLPLEVRQKIYTHVEDPDQILAKSIPEFFYAIAPDYFTEISIGAHEPHSQEERNFTDLVRIYPDSGKFVEILTIVTDRPHYSTIYQFLDSFPSEPKLQHVRLVFSMKRDSCPSLRQIGYELPLTNILQDSPDLSRLSFVNSLPSRVLINACIDRLTRLDIGFIPGSLHDINVPLEIPLPPLLEIISFTPVAAYNFTGAPPPTLSVIIINSDDYFTDTGITYSCRQFISRCTSVTSLAVVEDGNFLIFFPVETTFNRFLKLL